MGKDIDAEVKEILLAKSPPLVQDPTIIKVLAIKRKYVDQIRTFSLDEYRQVLSEDYDHMADTKIKDPWGKVRIIGRIGYQILFTFIRGADLGRQLGIVRGLNFHEILRKARYEAKGIEWPLDTDEKKAAVEKIDKETWDEMEALPQIFED
jgi:hypothetical protein